MTRAATTKGLSNPSERMGHIISVVGCGRMGLPTACLFSEAGFKVICLDSNPYIVNQVNKGVSPFVEPNLVSLLKKKCEERAYLCYN